LPSRRRRDPRLRPHTLPAFRHPESPVGGPRSGGRRSSRAVAASLVTQLLGDPADDLFGGAHFGTRRSASSSPPRRSLASGTRRHRASFRASAVGARTVPAVRRGAERPRAVHLRGPGKAHGDTSQKCRTPLRGFAGGAKSKGRSGVEVRSREPTSDELHSLIWYCVGKKKLTLTDMIWLTLNCRSSSLIRLSGNARSGPEPPVSMPPVFREIGRKRYSHPSDIHLLR